MSESKLPDHLDPERVKAIQARTLLNRGVFPEGGQALLWIWRGMPTTPDGTAGYNEGLFIFLHLCLFLMTLHSILIQMVKILCSMQMLA